jgi:YggT family protein
MRMKWYSLLQHLLRAPMVVKLAPITTLLLYASLAKLTSRKELQMLNPFIDLISSVISLVNLLLIIWLVLDILINFDIVNRHNPLIQRVYFTLSKLIEPLLRPIRKLLAKYLPNLGGIDISPIILVLLLNFLNNALYTWFYEL